MKTLIDAIVYATRIAWEGEDIKRMYEDIDSAKQAILERSSVRIADALPSECGSCKSAAEAADILAGLHTNGCDDTPPPKEGGFPLP